MPVERRKFEKRVRRGNEVRSFFCIGVVCKLSLLDWLGWVGWLVLLCFSCEGDVTCSFVVEVARWPSEPSTFSASSNTEIDPVSGIRSNIL